MSNYLKLQMQNTNNKNLQALEKPSTYHFIGKDTIDAIFIQRDEPIQPSDLIISQFTPFYI